MRSLISTLVVCMCAFLATTASALDCPPFPQQASKDWEVEVNAVIAKIGPVKGGELSTRVRSATKDLMGKLPDAARVYLEQMMYAGYCTALRDDKTISEGEKARQLKDYRREVLRARGQDKATARSLARLESMLGNVQKALDSDKTLDVQIDVHDSRMRDSGKVVATVSWKDGPIIDIGNKNALNKNRILLVAKYPDQLFLYLYDAHGRAYLLQSAFWKTDNLTQLECIWSSKSGFIAILADGKVLSGIQLPSLALFHDIGEEREILIGHSFEGVSGSGTIRDVGVFASKEL